MYMCWRIRRGRSCVIFCLCLLVSINIKAQITSPKPRPPRPTEERCPLPRQQCATPQNDMQWVSNIRTSRPFGSAAFTAVDLTWQPDNLAMDRVYVIAYRPLNSPNDSYTISDQIRNEENFSLTGLEHSTSFYIAVCRPQDNQTFLSKFEELLRIRECGWCSVCYTTRTAAIEVITASHTVNSVPNTDMFQCTAFGSPNPMSIMWTVIDPVTKERVQVFDGERNVTITENSVVGNGIQSTLEVPIEEDLLVEGQIQCVATNGIVSYTQMFVIKDSPTATESNSSTVSVWAIIIIVIIVVFLLSLPGILIGVFVSYKYRRHVKSKKKNHLESASELTQTRQMLSSNEYYSCKSFNTSNDASISIPKEKIIPSSMIKLSKVVGQGEFGVVYKGTLTGRGSATELVAVKTLKGLFATDLDIQNATEEILKMQSFDHPNVMTLIGVCMSEEVGGSGGPSIVMPYMSKGSLLDYLRKEGENIKPTSEDDITQICSVQKLLVQICVQIAKGMEYLANLKFVHRDLAARNCMIGGNGIIKVSDFGFGEDMYKKNYFRQNEADSVKLPVKWMSLESLKLGIFSEKSDVWSYGVTCWEVFTAGEIPYPGVHPRLVIRLIEDGERLDKPKNEACSDEMYGLMLSCWEPDPDNRPTFSEIVVLLESQLLSMAEYLDLSIVPDEEADTETINSDKITED